MQKNYDKILQILWFMSIPLNINNPEVGFSRTSGLYYTKVIYGWAVAPDNALSRSPVPLYTYRREGLPDLYSELYASLF